MLWWYWWILGFVLVIAELAVPSFFILWFGLSALVVGVVVAMAPGFSVEGQIVVWAVLSVILLGLWLRVFKPRTATRSGTAGEILGEVGLLSKDVAPFINGQVRFQRPILGSDLWECTADEPIRAGERVCVTAIEGKALKVKAVTKT